MSEDQLAKLKKENPDAWAEIQRLTTLVEQLQRHLQQALDGNEKMHATLKTMQEKLDALLVQTKKRNKKQYGKKTERHNPRPAIKQPREKEKATGIKHITENAKNLTIEPVHYHVEKENETCPCCKVQTAPVTDVVTHQLEMVSASLKILEHRQATRACPKCKQYIVTAEKPSAPIPGSYAGPRLLGEIIVGKHDDGLPNNRQEKIFARHNIVVPRSTQCDWMQVTAATLSVLHRVHIEELFKSTIIKTDDTLIKIQDRGHRDNSRKGKITVYVGNSEHKPTIFDFSPDQSFARNVEFLEPFAGIVQADAAGGFDALFKDGKRTGAGCSAHSRRRYFESSFTNTDFCNTVLDIYKALYKIEREIKNKPAAIRLAVRRRKSKPLHTAVVNAKGTLHPTHDLMKAINYTLNHWIALTRFLKNPDIAIDNNEAERSIKCWVLVRKNSLFAGSDEGAKATALHLSFIASCKRNGVNPVDWYADVLSRINSVRHTDEELQKLLPSRWSPPQGP